MLRTTWSLSYVSMSRLGSELMLTFSARWQHCLYCRTDSTFIYGFSTSFPLKGMRNYCLSLVFITSSTIVHITRCFEITAQQFRRPPHRLPVAGLDAR